VVVDCRSEFLENSGTFDATKFGVDAVLISQRLSKEEAAKLAMLDTPSPKNANGD
jgi:hypothetical protein